MHILVHHFFTPHHTNNHRARALHPDALLMYVLLFAIFNFGFRLLHRQYPDVLGYAIDIRVEQLLADTNARRQVAGFSPLRLNAQLSLAAAGKAQDMFAKNYWAHIAPDGKTPWDFILGSGYRYTMAGENLAKNFSTSDRVVDAWMASQTHKENLLKPGYQEVGLAVVNGILGGEETTLVVQMFGTTKQLALAPPSPNVPAMEEVKPVVVTEVAGETQKQQGTAVSEFIASYKNPLFDLPTLTRTLAFSFGGFMLALLVVDVWFVTRRRIVRVSGHSIAHILFLSALFIGMSAILQGAIL